MKKPIEIKCKVCGQTKTIMADPSDIEKWKSGEGHIQDILHYLPADQRELLISGICGICFDEMFPPEEEGE
jgi:hypothetical protein